MDPDYEQLSNDVDLIARMKKFGEATNQIVNIMKPLDNQELYEKLSVSNQIKYNLLLSFGMNSLFWMYLRGEGIDPSTHRIKAENERLKQSMARSQRIKDRKTIMPRLNKGAANRFVRHGLWTPGKNPKDVAPSPKPRADATSTETPMVLSTEAPSTTWPGSVVYPSTEKEKIII